MGKERIGYRRLYDAIGCSLAKGKEIFIPFSIGGIQAEVYLGPKPKLGIMVNHSERYIVPGANSLFLNSEYKSDAAASNYPRNFFVEILCSILVDVPENVSIGFQKKEASANSQLLHLAEQNSEYFCSVTDLIAGVIGLRIHRQFVIEMINENYFARRNSGDSAFNYSSPALEVLEGISLNENGIVILSNLLNYIGKVDSRVRKVGAAALTWLLRAWSERDTISKFVALFIPLEIVLAGYGEATKIKKERDEKAIIIRDLLIKNGGENSTNLLAFFNSLISQQSPSLASSSRRSCKPFMDDYSSATSP